MSKSYKNPITRQRSRMIRLLEMAERLDKKCHVPLDVTHGQKHDDILDDAMDLLGGRALLNQSFEVAEIADGVCVRSERSWIIRPEGAMFVEGQPFSLSTARRPEEPAERGSSQLWHFAGGLSIGRDEVGFCEYDAVQRRGNIIIAFNGSLIPSLTAKFPHLEQKIKVFKPEEYDWLLSNW